MTIEKGLIGWEDVNFGSDTFQRKSQSGSLITLTKIRASHLPIVDSAGRFTGTEVETALSECLTREENGSPVKTLTNKSGAQRVAGDVVIIDTSNDNSFTTTTTVGNTLALGIVLETIANNATGKVATGGYVSAVTVDASTTRGQYLRTATTAGKATPGSTFAFGAFAVALSSHASSVSAYIFGAVAGITHTHSQSEVIVIPYSAFIPEGDGYPFTKADIGLTTIEVSAAAFSAPVVLPVGAIITNIRFNWFRNNSGAGTLFGNLIRHINGVDSSLKLLTSTSTVGWHITADTLSATVESGYGYMLQVIMTPAPAAGALTVALDWAELTYTYDYAS